MAVCIGHTPRHRQVVGFAFDLVTFDLIALGKAFVGASLQSAASSY